jgi:hypothetical protein
MSKPHNILGTSNKPVSVKMRKVVKLNASSYGGDARQNYNDNYDRIFNSTKKTKEAK